MKKTLNTETLINAPLHRVWQILLDFAAYPQWDPFITHISGDIQTGGRLNITVQPVGGKAISFSPRVTFEKYPDLGIPNTTNLLESHFSELKAASQYHRGLNQEHKIQFILDYFSN
ncbi:SRPBCC family protein [Neisseria dentiae]|uniref:SRPBCC family protein n=1 Tax=Neisseria dentiae TaxID=194197 RepID=UPI00359FDFE5